MRSIFCKASDKYFYCEMNLQIFTMYRVECRNNLIEPLHFSDDETLAQRDVIVCLMNVT